MFCYQYSSHLLKVLTTLYLISVFCIIFLPLTVFCCVNVLPFLLSRWLHSLMPAVLQVMGVALCPPVVERAGQIQGWAGQIQGLA